jgi:hypothetical protein
MKTEHTPGPWRWFGNSDTQSIYLATADRGRQYVMGFERWGMGNGQPRFRVDDRMVDAKHLLAFEVGDKDVTGIEQAKKNDTVYRRDIRGINHADALLIAAAPDLLAALKALLYAPTDLVAQSGAHQAIAKAEGKE